MPTIEIVISGPRRSGKSILARRLHHYLVSHGLPVEGLDESDIYAGKNAITSAGLLMRIIRSISPRIRIRTQESDHEP